MEFRILGPVRIHRGGREDEVSGSKQRTMLAALLLAEGRAVSDEGMVRMLWGEHPPATAGDQIQTYASRIRQRVGDAVRLERVRTGYRMPQEDVDLDYRGFRALVNHARTAADDKQYAQAATQLRGALDLWRGEALADTTEHMIFAEQPHLEEERIEALELRIAADLNLGRQHELIPELKKLVSRHPSRERLRALLMTALYRADRQADAITEFQEGRRLLDEEFGVEPGHLLTLTYQGVLNGEARSWVP